MCWGVDVLVLLQNNADNSLRLYEMKPQNYDWVDRKLYPFELRSINIGGYNLHYVDEGAGDTVVFVHGTPEWSFAYRDIIKALRSTYRCVAIDLLGFGLSDKPAVADYSCEAHATRLGTFIRQLQVKNITLVANDFGGGIGLGYAIANPTNVARVILINTWMRSLKDDPHYAVPARIINSWLGRFLYQQMNFPVNTIMPAAYGNKKHLTKQIHAHYKRPLSKGYRHATFAFAKQLMDASPWWESNWEKLDVLRDKPFSFFWGMKDKFVPPTEMTRWQKKLPEAFFKTFEDAGHFVHEEKASEISEAIGLFMSKTTNALSVQ